MGLLYIIRGFLGALLRVYELLFIVRALLSWFPGANTGGIGEFLYAVTEPILAPIRQVLWKIPFLQGIPIDFSVLVAYILIDVIRSIIL
ncbi:MAG: YggT family protein [Oscillospiraceae bacterium]|nr:YggT family protein [Oscillospiraceae bacterium]MBQ2742376.1 YggT family protein [Oscillospiraceae bacterium]MBQ4315836.1 YggT family protein [Oscillospiraceae bacterium]MBQ7055276.1 YggT family protein [Oscillospiraceae bacterium]MBR2181179.1 YggT family protein [Oscillospiraceae bacterium]